MTTTSEVEKKRIPNVVTRAITTLLVLPIIIVAALQGGWVFTVLTMFGASLAILEFLVMEKDRETQGSPLVGIPVTLVVILAFHLQDNTLWLGGLGVGTLATIVLEMLRHQNIRRSLWQVGSTLVGVFYIAFPTGFLVAIRALTPPPDIGLIWLFVVFTITWGTDTMAYVGGRWFGRTPLAPRISPKKTREGAVIGFISGVILPSIILVASGLMSIPTLIVILIAPAVAIFGDLFESSLKRFLKVKDSHVKGVNIIPGHGGMLDRIDALLWVSTLIYVYLALMGPLGGVGG